MDIKETIRGRVRGPKEVELEESLDLPVGSEVSINISFSGTFSGAGVADRFKHAAGSWRDVPEEFIKSAYADRFHRTRDDVIL